jgi:SNARE associated Golgi protein
MQSWGHGAAAAPAGRRVIRPPNVALAGRATVIMTIIALAIYFAAADQPFGISISEDSIAAWIGSLGSIGGLGIIALMIAHSVIPFPVEIVTFIAGALFGLYWGTLCVWTGAMIGASVAFAIARRCGRSAVPTIISPAAHKRLEAWAGTPRCKDTPRRPFDPSNLVQPRKLCSRAHRRPMVDLPLDDWRRHLAAHDLPRLSRREHACRFMDKLDRASFLRGHYLGWHADREELCDVAHPGR